jgi:putative nucleotidyltransferase with HDIG domain
VVLIAGVTVVSTVGPFGDATFESPQLLFSLVTVAAAACVLALMAASVMPLVHGLVTPGVLYDDTAAFRTAAFLSLPIATVVVAPLLSPHSAFGRWAARRWRDWTLLSLLGVFAIASVVVGFPSVIEVPGPSEPVTIALSVGLLVVMVALSLRQLRYYDIGGQPANLIASVSLVLLSVTALLPMSNEDYSAGFWWLHITGVVGVLGACIGLAVSKRMSRNVHDVLGPVLARDPLVAFELGLSPVVHRFVASIDAKDEQTREHVVRTAEMAIRVGERFHLPARQLRELGLAALLHDVGKLETPIEILDKPSRLTPEEYEIVKLHAVTGAQMLMAEPALASVAPIVRSHHERIDGRGYPDGLVGDEIPLSSRIIAVCDAFDAMTHEHRFRAALQPSMAFSVLREHEGSQWDAKVIDHVMAVLPAMALSGQLYHVGRGGRSSESVAINETAVDDVGDLLIAVDAEI